MPSGQRVPISIVRARIGWLPSIMSMQTMSRPLRTIRYTESCMRSAIFSSVGWQTSFRLKCGEAASPSS
jgi:hypothetical protein